MKFGGYGYRVKSNTFQAAIIGAVGYTGAEIVRLLHDHPCLKPSVVTSSHFEGEPLSRRCPWLATDLVLASIKDVKKADIIFVCQDAAFSMEHQESFISKAKVVDLSPAYRLRDKLKFESIYKLPWGGSRVYGLPELGNREEIAATNFVANPGCHATATLLALAPLVKAGLADGFPVVDSKSGTSGAGRSKQETQYLFSEHYDGFNAYSSVGHRHIPEIEENLGIKVRFTPHLLPVSRGIEVTCHVPLKAGVTEEAVLGAYHQAYQQEPFVQIVNCPPSVKQVHGSNRCDIFVTVDKETQFAVVMAVLDNMVKGASGQAIQNANLMLGLPENLGLPIHGVWP